MSPPSRILLVDDDIDMVALLARHLRDAGFEVITSFDGAQALQEIDQADPAPDLCLVDRNLPGISGIDVLWKLRHRKADHPIPCILLSSDNDPEHRAQALNLGATDFVMKPFEPREILHRVARVLEEVRHNQGLPNPGDTSAAALAQLARPDMEGTLRSVNLSDLVQLFLLTSRTCEISLTRGPLAARICVERGEVVDARITSEPQMTADQAFLRASMWRAGHFHCRFGPVTGARRTQRSTAALLFDVSSAQTGHKDPGGNDSEELPGVPR